MIFYQVLIQIYIKIYLKWINKYKTKITLNFSLYLNSWCRKSKNPVEKVKYLEKL